jgi:hypothetical protein
MVDVQAMGIVAGHRVQVCLTGNQRAHRFSMILRMNGGLNSRYAHLVDCSAASILAAFFIPEAKNYS